jgi:hypothetical protein
MDAPVGMCPHFDYYSPSAKRGCGASDPAGFPNADPTVRRSCILTDWERAEESRAIKV